MLISGPLLYSGGAMQHKKALVLIVLIILFGFILRIPYFLHVMQDIDEGCYAGIAAVLMDGGLPYLNAVENKPPAIFYIYKFTFSLFGKYNMLAVHMVTFVCTLCTAIVLSLLAKKIGGMKSALFALLFYLTFTAALYAKMIAANTEIFMALPYSLAVLLFWYAVTKEKGWLYFLSGLVCGLAPLVKQVGGVQLIAAFICLSAHHRSSFVWEKDNYSVLPRLYAIWHRVQHPDSCRCFRFL
jgi:4-amino-4-deoxy-L-arabinose transferase-like glycosyltransferase